MKREFTMRRLLLVCIFVLAGCATPYQQQSFTGGFSETRLSENIFQVNFKGNGYTSAERASDFTLLRGAEITLENGYRYFALMDSENTEKTSFHQTPIRAHTTGNVNTYGGSSNISATTTFTGGQINTIRKPRSFNTIICFENKPKDVQFVFDAEFLKQSIQSKYELNKEAKDTESSSAE